MTAKRLSEESGYSLVEVMAAIVIMTLAILPMMAMFDTGLHSAISGSNYDKARALANLKLEQAKNLPFGTVRESFPMAAGAPGTPTTYTAGHYQSGWLTESGAASGDFTNFQYRVEKQYIAQPPTGSVDPPEPIDPDGDGEEDFVPSTTPTNLIRVTVTVRWPNGNEYTTLGLVTN